jgi:hypothetical protein
MDGSNPAAWRPCHDCGAHVGSGRLVFGNPSGGRLQSFNGLTHEASGCRFWAARVGAQPYGVGGDGLTRLSSPEIAKLRDQQAQRQPSLGTFPAPEAGERKLEPAAQTPNRRANGNEGISRIVGRLGPAEPASMTTSPSVVVSRFQSSGTIVSAAAQTSPIRLASSVLPTLAKVWRMSDAVSDTTSIAVLSAE